MVPQGYGLNASVSVTQRVPKSRQRVVIAIRRVRKTVEQPVHALEHRARADEATARQQCGADARLRRPSGMQPLGPGAFGKIFDDAAGHAAGDAERIDNLAGVETKRSANAGRRAHRTKNRRRMKTRLVDGLRHHEAQSAQHFGADRNSDQGHPPVGIVPFAGGKHRRHDHRAGMHRAAFERVVEILAMRSSAIDEGGARRVQRSHVTDRRAGAVIVATRQRALDIILVARGDAEADDIDQQILAFTRGHGRQRAGFRATIFSASASATEVFQQAVQRSFRSDPEDLGVARLDRIALFLNRRCVVLHSLDIL